MIETDSTKVVKGIIGRGIDWYDCTKMDAHSWGEYYNDAQAIIRSEVFNNELKHYVADLVKFISYESKDFDQVMHIRTAIVALETFKERLESIENPIKQKVETDEFSPL